MEYKCVFGVNIRLGVDKVLVFVCLVFFFKDVLYVLGLIIYFLRGVRFFMIKIYLFLNDDVCVGRNYFIIV